MSCRRRLIRAAVHNRENLVHVGLVSATYDADVVNGVLRMVQLYRKHLEARGHQVTIFTLGEERSVDTAVGVVRSPGLPLGDFGYYAGLGYTPEAQRLLAMVDIVHCHHLFMSLEMAHRYADSPIVYTNHTRYDLYTSSYAHIPQPLADVALRYAWPHYTDMADVVIAPSEGLKEVMEAFGVQSAIEVIENGIELEPFMTPENPLQKADLAIAEDSVLAMYCGRLSVEKNIETLLQEFTIAARQCPSLCLLLIGKGPLEAEIQRIAAENDLIDRIFLVGTVPYLDVANYLAAGDMFITASTSEVHPLTVIEAMAAGLPVVAVRSPGMNETVVSGETGILVDSGRGVFAEAILSLAGAPDHRVRLGQAARASSGRYNINHTVDQTLALYNDLLARRPDRQRQDPHGKWRNRTEAWEARWSGLSQVFHPDSSREKP